MSHIFWKMNKAYCWILFENQPHKGTVDLLHFSTHEECIQLVEDAISRRSLGVILEFHFRGMTGFQFLLANFELAKPFFEKLITTLSKVGVILRCPYRTAGIQQLLNLCSVDITVHIDIQYSPIENLILPPNVSLLTLVSDDQELLSFERVEVLELRSHMISLNQSLTRKKAPCLKRLTLDGAQYVCGVPLIVPFIDILTSPVRIFSDTKIQTQEEFMSMMQLLTYPGNPAKQLSPFNDILQTYWRDLTDCVRVFRFAIHVRASTTIPRLYKPHLKPLSRDILTRLLEMFITM